MSPTAFATARDALAHRLPAEIPGFGTFTPRSRPGFGGAPRWYVVFHPTPALLDAVAGRAAAEPGWIAAVVADLRQSGVAVLDGLGELRVGEAPEAGAGDVGLRVPVFHAARELRARMGEAG